MERRYEQPHIRFDTMKCLHCQLIFYEIAHEDTMGNFRLLNCPHCNVEFNGRDVEKIEDQLVKVELNPINGEIYFANHLIPPGGWTGE
jgi:hypothetical protein